MTFRQIFTFFALYAAALPFCKTAHGQTEIVHQTALPEASSWCSDAMITGLLDQINTLRQNSGLPGLALDTLGMRDAELRVLQVAGYAASNPPSPANLNARESFDTTAAHLRYAAVGENLAYMTTSPEHIVNYDWQAPAQRAPMLSKDAEVAGISCVYARGTTFWTFEPGRSATGATPRTVTAASLPTLDTEEAAFLTLINNYRAQNGAGALQVSVALQLDDVWMSTDMATKNYFSHTDSLGRSPGTRLLAFNYPYFPWGENIAAGFSSAQSTFTQWQTACDPDGSGNCTYAHRQNMLNPAFKVIGIARAYGAGSTYLWYWTTDFGGVVDQLIDPNPNPGTAPVINSFSSSPAQVTAGQPSTLSWTVSGATTLSLSSGIGTVTGTSLAITPGQTTAYTLTATNSYGSATAVTTVTVIPPASPAPGISISANGSGCFTATVQGIQNTATTWSIAPQTGRLNVVSVWIGVAPASMGGAPSGQLDIACYTPATSGSLPSSITLTATSVANTSITSSIALDPISGKPK